MVTGLDSTKSTAACMPGVASGVSPRPDAREIQRATEGTSGFGQERDSRHRGTRAAARPAGAHR